MLQVVEINAIEHLEAIRLRWTSLLNETPGGSFLHTLDWLKVYWRHYGGDQRLRVFLVYRGGTVLGILPMVVQERETTAGLGDVLTYPVINANQFIGPIGPNPTATLMASFRHLAGESRDWDLLSLGSIGEHDRGRTANALELAGFCPREVEQGTVSKVCFDASWPDTHVRWRSKAVEQQHCNGSTALEGHRTAEIAGDRTFERIRPLGSNYGDDQPLDGLVDECLTLQPHSSSEPSAALLRDVVTTASRLGMLDLNLLRLDGRLLAFSLNVHFDGAIQQLWFGEAAASFGFDPASVLTRQMLRDSFARNDQYLYFAESNDRVTDRWATQRLPVVRYQHPAAMPLRSQMARLGEWLTSRR